MELNAGSTIVIAPHPDDESLGCGGMIAMKRAAGLVVRIVFLTDGGKLPENSSSLHGDREHEYVALRRREALQAVGRLGVNPDDVEFLEYMDGHLANLTSASRNELIKKLGDILRSHRPCEVYVPHRRDCHPDHEAAYDLILNAIGENLERQSRLFQYVIWLPWLSPFASRFAIFNAATAYRLNITSVYSQKLRAIDMYRSQIQCFPAGFLNRFTFKFEIFHEVVFG